MNKVSYCRKCYETDVMEGSYLCSDCFLKIERELQEYYKNLEGEEMKYETPTYENIAIFSRRQAEEAKRPNCDGTFDEYSELREASIKNHELIAEACEKQVPKKLKIESIGSVCPECFYDTVFMSKNEEYCPRCGQKLDMNW